MKGLNDVLRPVEELIDTLLNAEVIECTIKIMRSLRSNMLLLASYVENMHEHLTREDIAQLKEVLLPLVSESIREALHKWELHITNEIIRGKNRVFTAIRMEIPDDHKEIRAEDYPKYDW